MRLNTPITPCLWYDSEAEQAAGLYCSIFPGSKITHVTHYPDAGQEVHGKPAGAVMVVAFELNGQPFTALNGGPIFKFDEAVSLQILCETQAEIDHYWSVFLENGGEEGPSGWLKDCYGLSWQITTNRFAEWLTGDPDASARVMTAMLQMHKIDIGVLQKAHIGAD